MSTLLLRFAAPLQSWGLDKFERRGTSRIPTKSAVIGMAMAALGMKRNEEIPQELLSLRFGVRCDDEGVIIRDYHTVKTIKDYTSRIVNTLEAGKDKLFVTIKTEIDYDGDTYETTRYYLCDAVFLIGLEGDEGYLEKLEYAFNNPVYPIYLGRKSCPPEGRVVLGIRNLTLEQALKQEKWLLPQWRQEQRMKNKDCVTLRLFFDADVNDTGYYVEDMPVSFDFRHRRHSTRKVKEPPPLVLIKKSPEDHDAYATAKEEGYVSFQD